jgi:hypothetical protein
VKSQRGQAAGLPGGDLGTPVPGGGVQAATPAALSHRAGAAR